MNPFERWDDWEWERAAQEVGRERGMKFEDWPVKRTPPKHPNREILHSWTEMQKKAVLSVVFFLLMFFASKGQDAMSQFIYSAYKGTIQNGDLYAQMNDMAKEALGMGTIGSKSTPVDAAMKGKFVPPISGPVMAAFGTMDGGQGKGSIHNGIDIGSSLGIPVVSPYTGVVIEVGEDAQLGRLVKLDFANGWIAVLANLGDVKVQKGQAIQTGDIIGTVGLSAPLKKPWLHFELRKDGKPVNPLPYLVQTAK
ncbi:murein hydrolase activator EnvC family protein [Desulfitobacterium sp.]|uniref:murein hydrolase activator EnvC family protein n=1 Tax=Desulfitobacterium sp. TaxID=49981 RepID=UPI002B1F3C6F|nr:peptidoglycan DD-metalloendopeptidase family protein [Desulfitobacterium sp.]MEA4902336.1 peptidoglycan DD-metalloendopeptidase family protein [Desulfitobacterium sp.]